MPLYVLRGGRRVQVPRAIEAKGGAAIDAWLATLEDATDAARELAEAEGVDLAAAQGTGADGRVTKADVEALLAATEDDEEEG